MQIFVKTPTGKTITLDAEMSGTIGNVKAKIWGKKGIPPDAYLVAFGKRLLRDFERLDKYSIQEEKPLRLIPTSKLKPPPAASPTRRFRKLRPPPTEPVELE